MKLVTYQKSDGIPLLGGIKGDRVYSLHYATAGRLPEDMRLFLEFGDQGMEVAREALENATGGISLDEVSLLAPVTNPGKIIAIGLNYRDHVEEAGLPFPEIATMFCKFTSSVIGQGQAIRWRRQMTGKVDWEAELAVVIGRTARNVSEADALDHVAGYMNCNDVSARDLQLERGDQWLRGKCLDTFCPLGPWLVTRDEVPDPGALGIRALVNGMVMQDSTTANLIYDVPWLIRYLSEAFTLQPGDIIITGTPAGVGAFRQPPVWLDDGDEVTIEIDGLGSLTNPCVVEPDR
jgi:2-keto-4-pentenoate hydratase/2-oxohepta-3-ene-1,7-dioic acid hydratase in catechol pathway